MPDFAENKRWSDTYMKSARSILAGVFDVDISDVRFAPSKFDNELAADLYITIGLPRTIAVRIRKGKYADVAKYADEFTLRTRLSSGVETEFEKIVKGLGDFLFYGFGCDGTVVRWFVGDLSVFREWYFAGGNRMIASMREIRNWDQETFFKAIPIRWLPNWFIVSASWLGGAEGTSGQRDLFM